MTLEMAQQDHDLGVPTAVLDMLKKIYDTYQQTDCIGRVVILHGPRGLWTDTTLDRFKHHVTTARDTYIEATAQGDATSAYA